MGQYHIPVNISRKEFFHPHLLGSGLKQWEQGNISAWNSRNTMAKPGQKSKIETWAVVPIALYAGLCTSINRGGGDYDDHPWLGRWSGGIVVIAGDYGEQGDIATRSGNGTQNRDDCDLYYDCCVDNDEEWAQVLEWAKEKDPDGEQDLVRRYERVGPFTNVTPLVEDWYLKEFGMIFEGAGWREMKFVGRPDQVAS